MRQQTTQSLETWTRGMIPKIWSMFGVSSMSRPAGIHNRGQNPDKGWAIEHYWSSLHMSADHIVVGRPHRGNYSHIAPWGDIESFLSLFPRAAESDARVIVADVVIARPSQEY